MFGAIEAGAGDAARRELPRARRHRAAAAAEAQRRPQPHLAVRLHRQQVRVPRGRRVQSIALPNTVLNTIVAEALDYAGAEIEAAGDGERSRRPCWRGQRRLTAHQRILFNGDNYAEEWHAEAERRGLPNLRQRPTPCRG